MQALFNAWKKSWRAATKKGAIAKVIAAVYAKSGSLLAVAGVCAVLFTVLEKIAAALLVAHPESAMVIHGLWLEGMLRPFLLFGAILYVSDTKRRAWGSYAKGAALYSVVKTVLFALFIAMLGLVAHMMTTPFCRMCVLRGSYLVMDLAQAAVTFAIFAWVYGNTRVTSALHQGWRMIFMELPFLVVSTLCVLPVYALIYVHSYVVTNYVPTSFWRSGGVLKLLVLVLSCGAYLLWFVAYIAIWAEVYRTRKKALAAKVRKTDALTDEY